MSVKVIMIVVQLRLVRIISVFHHVLQGHVHQLLTVMLLTTGLSVHVLGDIWETLMSLAEQSVYPIVTAHQIDLHVYIQNV